MSEVNDSALPIEEQMEKMQKALDRYKKENEKFRLERDDWKSKYESGVSEDETISALRAQVTKAEAKLRLQKEGIKDVDRVVGRMDFSNVGFDDDGNINGLDEQVESLKTDIPELFDHKRRVAGGADGSSQGSAPSLTPTEQAVRRIFNH